MGSKKRGAKQKKGQKGGKTQNWGTKKGIVYGLQVLGEGRGRGENHIGVYCAMKGKIGPDPENTGKKPREATGGGATQRGRYLTKTYRTPQERSREKRTLN